MAKHIDFKIDNTSFFKNIDVSLKSFRSPLILKNDNKEISDTFESFIKRNIISSNILLGVDGTSNICSFLTLPLNIFDFWFDNIRIVRNIYTIKKLYIKLSNLYIFDDSNEKHNIDSNNLYTILIPSDNSPTSKYGYVCKMNSEKTIQDNKEIELPTQQDIISNKLISKSNHNWFNTEKEVYIWKMNQEVTINIPIIKKTFNAKMQNNIMQQLPIDIPNTIINYTSATSSTPPTPTTSTKLRKKLYETRKYSPIQRSYIIKQNTITDISNQEINSYGPVRIGVPKTNLKNNKQYKISFIMQKFIEINMLQDGYDNQQIYILPHINCGKFKYNAIASSEVLEINSDLI
uniref:Uncharacterized protein n=1 Tax=Faxonius propinquus nudivirus TaxID=3139431 RepID=A0AAU8GBM7_9VIRU